MPSGPKTPRTRLRNRGEDQSLRPPRGPNREDRFGRHPRYSVAEPRRAQVQTQVPSPTETPADITELEWGGPDQGSMANKRVEVNAKRQRGDRPAAKRASGLSAP